jgi:hypothetical protein
LHWREDASIVVAGIAAAELALLALDLTTTHVMAGVDAAVHDVGLSVQVARSLAVDPWLESAWFQPFNP